MLAIEFLIFEIFEFESHGIYYALQILKFSLLHSDLILKLCGLANSVFSLFLVL